MHSTTATVVVTILWKGCQYGPVWAMEVGMEAFLTAIVRLCFYNLSVNICLNAWCKLFQVTIVWPMYHRMNLKYTSYWQQFLSVLWLFWWFFLYLQLYQNTKQVWSSRTCKLEWISYHVFMKKLGSFSSYQIIHKMTWTKMLHMRSKKWKKKF